MQKSDLLIEVSKETGIDLKTVKIVFNTAIKIIKKNLLFGIDVKITGFMNLVIKTRQEREAFHVQKKKYVKLPKRYYVDVKLQRSFVEKMNNKTVY